MQPVDTLPDPAPSRWSYRMQRLLLTPLFRVFLRLVLPFAVVAGGTLIWLSDQDRTDQLMMVYNDIRTEIVSRPEVTVSAMAIDGASQGIAEDIREIMPIDFPTSSFDLDLSEIQERVSELPAIAKASVRVRPGGILQITVAERAPVILWRTYDGLALVDVEGYVTGPARARALHPELPLMAGEGADRHVEEAIRLYAAAGPLTERMRGLTIVSADGEQSAPIAGTPPAEQAMPASVATVEPREAILWDEFSGRLEAVDRIDVRARVGGAVQATHFAEGELVNL